MYLTLMCMHVLHDLTTDSYYVDSNLKKKMNWEFTYAWMLHLLPFIYFDLCNTFLEDLLYIDVNEFRIRTQPIGF